MAPPEVPRRNETLLDGSHPLSGATAANLSPALAEELSAVGVPDAGVIILDLRRGSPAALMRFAPGDIILAINDEKIETVADLELCPARGPPGLAHYRSARLAAHQHDGAAVEHPVRGAGAAPVG